MVCGGMGKWTKAPYQRTTFSPGLCSASLEIQFYIWQIYKASWSTYVLDYFSWIFEKNLPHLKIISWNQFTCPWSTHFNRFLCSRHTMTCSMNSQNFLKAGINWKLSISRNFLFSSTKILKGCRLLTKTDNTRLTTRHFSEEA